MRNADFGDGLEKAGGVGGVDAIAGDDFDALFVDAGGVGGGDGDAAAGFFDGRFVVGGVGVVAPAGVGGDGRHGGCLLFGGGCDVVVVMRERVLLISGRKTNDIIGSVV